MHSKWGRVAGGRESKKERSLGPRIKLVLALVGVRYESKTDFKFKKGHQHLDNPTPSKNTNVNWTSLAPRRAVIEMPSVAESHVVSVVVFMEVSAW